MQTVDSILATLGYKRTKWVEGYSSIAQLYPKNRCGIYVLHFANGDYYAGQSINVARRYCDHRKNHSDIQQISFMPVPQKRLNEVETHVVRTLENAGLHLRNINIVSFSYGTTDFDDVMSPEDQLRWRDDMEFDDLRGERPNDPELRRKYTARYQQFMQLPQAEDIIEFVSYYVKVLIPAAYRSEASFWNVSCCPYPALPVRINAGWQTVLDIIRVNGNGFGARFYMKQSDFEQIFDQKVNLAHGDYFYEFGHKLDGVAPLTVYHSLLTKGGKDQCCVETSNLTYGFELIMDIEAMKAIRQFNLGLVQKSPCSWARNHCFDLADRLLD